LDELALACQDDWPGAVALLRLGAFEAFLGGIGRHDLAGEAREAARFLAGPAGGIDDAGFADRALDRFLAGLPVQSVHPPLLAVEPAEIALGRVRIGADVRSELRLVNRGMRLLHGTVTSDAPWLLLGDGEGARGKLFGCLRETTLAVRVRGRALRAGLQPLRGRLLIDSCAGRCVVAVTLEAPPQTFAAGVLAGARTPRQLAEKARLAPKESARLFETGAVARWYRDNGWTYPVEGEPAAGLAAVQQFFDALGLSAPPRLELSRPALALAGRPGDALVASLRVGAAEKRPVYARAASDQPWLVVSGVDLDGSQAHVRLSVPSVPDRPGEKLHATLRVTGNARQRFVVPVSLRVAGAARKAVAPPPPPAAGAILSETATEWLALTQAEQPALPGADGPPAELDWLPAEEAPRQPPVLTPVRPPPGARSFRSGTRPVGVWLALGAAALLLSAGLFAGCLVGVHRPPAPEEQPPATPQRVNPPTDQQPAAPKAPPRDQEVPVKVVQPPAPIPLPPRRPGGVGMLPVLPPRPPPLLVPEFVRREVEVVFCIDTTGSMKALLAGVKQKIWAVCNQIAGGKPTPDLQVGLVAYRDRGDAYVTKVVDLSRDLDAVHAALHTLEAAGGGDTPESVNQALYDAVHKVRWSADRKTLKIIFLVGDAPPHMDYKDDVKYPETCKKAVEKGILINAVQCGADADCKQAWRDIAEKGRGAYLAVPQTGGVVTRTTPFDGPLAQVGRELLDTVLLYGPPARKARGERAVAAARRLAGPAAADRAAFSAKSRRIGPYDLLDAVRDKRVKLEALPPDELPEPLRRLADPAAREAFLANVARRREKLQERALELEGRRARALAEQRKRHDPAKSFDGEVLGALREQAKKFAIAY
jgi:hypothetical protein